MDPLPIGSLISYYNGIETRPRGYVRCDGAKIYQDDYPKLVGGVIPISGEDVDGLSRRKYGYVPVKKYVEEYVADDNRPQTCLLFSAFQNGINGGPSIIGDQARVWYEPAVGRRFGYSDANKFKITPDPNAGQTDILFPAIWGGLNSGGVYVDGIGTLVNPASCVFEIECYNYNTVASFAKVRLQYLSYGSVWRDLAQQSGVHSYKGTVTAGQSTHCTAVVTYFEPNFSLYPPLVSTGLTAGSVRPLINGTDLYMRFRVVHYIDVAQAVNGLGNAANPNTTSDTEVYGTLKVTYTPPFSSGTNATQYMYIRAQ